VNALHPFVVLALCACAGVMLDRRFGELRRLHPLVGFGHLAGWLQTRMNVIARQGHPLTRLSGLLAMFPVMASVLAVFSHHQAGAGFSIRLLRAMVYGYYAFAGFCLVLALALPAMSRGLAFTLALGVAVVIQALARSRMQRAAL